MEAQGVLFDITQLCTCFTAVSFDFISRVLNEDAYADALAKAALPLKHCLSFYIKE